MSLKVKETKDFRLSVPVRRSNQRIQFCQGSAGHYESVGQTNTVSFFILELEHREGSSTGVLCSSVDMEVHDRLA